MIVSRRVPEIDEKAARSQAIAQKVRRDPQVYAFNRDAVVPLNHRLRRDVVRRVDPDIEAQSVAGADIERRGSRRDGVIVNTIERERLGNFACSK